MPLEVVMGVLHLHQYLELPQPQVGQVQRVVILAFRQGIPDIHIVLYPIGFVPFKIDLSNF